MRLWPYVVVIVLSFPLLIPYLLPGYFTTQDGGWAVVRLTEMHRELKELQIPPRWAGYLNHGYGYPLFLFAYPFPYYLGEFLHLIGFGFVESVKGVFLISIVVSGLTMYLLGSSLWGTVGGLISAIFYLYTPYRLVNLFIRGSIGESLALVFFPLLFWIILKLHHSPSWKRTLMGSLVFATLILTHNASTILFLPVLGIWVVMHLAEHVSGQGVSGLWGDLSQKYFMLLVVGMLLSAYSWLPAIVEKSFIVLDSIPLADKSAHYLSIGELFRANIGASKPPVTIGIIPLLAGAFGIAVLFFNRSSIKVRKLGIFLSLTLGITVFLLFHESNWLWQLPILGEIDFPWRILLIITFLISLAAGSLGINKLGRVLGVIAAIALFIISIKQIVILKRTNFADAYYATNDATTTSADELMPIWVKNKPTKLSTEKIQLVPSNYQNTGDTKISTYQILSQTSTNLRFDSTVREPVMARINTLYFPGWAVFIDGNTVPVSAEPQTGIINFPLAEGYHKVDLIFKRTPVRIAADILSILGITVVFGIWTFLKKYSR
ncbi:MAG: hypothetical protein AAB874_04385 [Patescibacteria group bacterium]